MISNKSSNTSELTYPIVTMGTFDGVHKAHQIVLKKLKSRAKEMNGQAVVITYYHHPLETINKEIFPYLITEKERKEKLLMKYGADVVLFLNFSAEMASMSALDFIKKILIDRIGTKEIIVGYDTHFGKNREGNFSFLKKHEYEFGYKTKKIDEVKIEGQSICSSCIRKMINDGKIDEVPNFLGRYYTVLGKVIKGYHFGKELVRKE